MCSKCQTAAASYIRRQAKQLGKQLPGVCSGEDIECVHRARVASRRLRAAFRVFSGCFGDRTLRRWRKHVRNLAQQLGQARDLDVQIDFLCGFVSHALEPSVCRGLSRLLAELERRRERMQPRVVRAVERFQRSGVLEEMLSRTKKMLDRPNGAAPEEATLEAAAELSPAIRARLEEYLALEDSLQEPDDVERLHSLRIAAKRLRYTLEIARLVYPTDLQPFIEAAKTLQTLLGEIHDCDVWQAELDDFQATMRKRLLRVYGSDRAMAQVEPGIELLRQDRCQRRQQLVEQATAFWRQMQQQGTWETLPRLLESASAMQTQSAVAGDNQLPPAAGGPPSASATPPLPPVVSDSAVAPIAREQNSPTDTGGQLHPDGMLSSGATATKHHAADSAHSHARRMRTVAVSSN